MDTQREPVHRHEDPHSVGTHHVVEGEDENHDKGSVLKKVKAKAKKIKDALGIKKHGHGHGQDQDRDQYHEEEEEDDEYEEEEEPEVYGAPASQEINPGQSRIDLAHKKPFDEDLDAPKDPSQAFSPSNYQTKVMDPTNASGGEEVGITPIIHSFGKMEVFDQPSQGQQKSHIDAGSHDQFFPDLSSSTETKTIPENPQSILENKNVGETIPQSSYTEKISSATSAIADKAISAKNIIATTVTEKLTPVYEKVAGAGSSVVSKVYVTSTSTRSAMDTSMGTGTDTETEGGGGGGVEIKKPDTNTSMATGIEGGGGVEKKSPDKGVSMKEYLAEKLKPSDEDKALSKVISEALHKWKDDGEGDKENNKPMGTVTESPEVAKRLGTNEEVGGGSGSPGKGMVKMIRGTVYSWLGKGTGESYTSQEYHSPSHGGGEQVRGDEVGQAKVGEGKLEESINQPKDQ